MDRRGAGNIRAARGSLARPQIRVNKRSFISFAGVAVLLAVLIPYWAFSSTGSKGSSSEKVAAGDEAAKQLFADNCGSCHALARAGTDGIVGPDLDDRLASIGPADGEEAIASTESRVLSAIETGLGNGRMPAGILTGENAGLVSNFVARAAGR